MTESNLKNHVLTLARAYKVGAEEAGDKDVTLFQSITIVLMGIIETVGDDSPSATLRDFMASSNTAAMTVETFLSMAVGAGYSLAAEDAIGAMDRAAKSAHAERN